MSVQIQSRAVGDGLQSYRPTAYLDQWVWIRIGAGCVR